MIPSSKKNTIANKVVQIEIKIIKQRAKTLIAFLSSFGNRIANSYLPVAIAENKVIIEM